MNNQTEPGPDDAILAFDPFDGDFGGQDDRTFVDKMSIARKEGPCSHCEATIAVGERVRRMASKFDGEMMSHRWCALCCAAMVLSVGGDWDAYEQRTPTRVR